MKRKFATGLLLSTLMLLFGVGDYRSQEAPEPPGAVIGVPGPQFLTAEGSAELGVTLEDVTAEMVRDLKLPGEYGALIESVEPDSAAAKGGLETGDVIVEFAGERVRSVAQLRRLIRETPAGRTVSLQVIRNGQARTLSAKLESRTNEFYVRVPEIHIPETRIAPPNPQMFEFRGFNPLSGGERASLGISGDELTTQLANFFGVKQGKGVLVREVLVGSPAAKAGLRAGDVIVAADGKTVATVADLRRALEVKPGEEKRKLNLTVVRNHQERTVPVELDKYVLSGPRFASRSRSIGIDAGDWQRAEAEAKAQIAAAQLALAQTQRQLLDRQHLMSETIRQAAEDCRRAFQEQFKLQLQKQLHALAGQNDII